MKYGNFDVDRLIESLTIYQSNGMPKLAIAGGGVQAFEEFVLARYFMFIQVYFHRTRRFFDIMLGKALKEVLPNGRFPEETNEYLKFDDGRVLQLIKDSVDKSDACYNIIHRKVYPRVCYTKTHPAVADKREFKRNKRELIEKIGEQFFIEDVSAGKMPHKIPLRIEKDDEKAIVIYDQKTGRVTTISEESEIIKSLSEKIDIMSLYCDPKKSQEAYEIMKKINEE